MITAIFRLSGWADRASDAATLAAGLNTPAVLQRTTLTAFFQAVMAAGADLADIDALGGKWGGRYIDRASQALADGDLAGISVLLALATGVSEATTAALQAVVAALTLTAGQAAWPEYDENGDPAGDPPAEFTAQWVTDTLTAAGYSWNGSQWVRG